MKTLLLVKELVYWLSIILNFGLFMYILNQMFIRKWNDNFNLCVEIEEKCSVDALARLIREQNIEDSDIEGYADSTLVNINNSHVRNHIKTIFISGMRDSELDVKSLLESTLQSILRNLSSLRTILSVFIIIGLFGTLIGLSSTLWQLHSAVEVSTNSATQENTQSAVQDNTKDPDDISGMLEQLKGAFVPSILGVLWTILGLFAYLYYVRNSCDPVRHALETKTLQTWVPKLRPARSKLLLDASREIASQMINASKEMTKHFHTASLEMRDLLERSGQTVRQSLTETGVDLQRLLAEVNREIISFNTMLVEAKESVKSVDSTVKKIRDTARILAEDFALRMQTFSDQFGKAVNQLTGFQDQVKNILTEVRDNSNIMKGEVVRSIKERGEYDAILKDYIKGHTELVANTSEYLKREIESAMKAMISVSELSRTALTGAIDKLGIDFSRQVITKSDELKGVLSSIDGRLVPITRSADQSVTEIQHILGLVGVLEKDTQKALSDLSQMLLRIIDETGKAKTAGVDTMGEVKALNKSLLIVSESACTKIEEWADKINLHLEAIKNSKM